MIAAAIPNPLNCTRQGGALKLHRGCGFGEVSIAPVHLQSRVNLPIAGTGTALAINYLTLGVVALSTRGTGRGGARNRADRESHALTKDDIANLMAAEREAYQIGLPFTRAICIHWEAAGVPLAGMVKATGRFLDMLTKWLARMGHQTAWLYVHENGDDKGGHCHLLVHVPAALVSRLTRLQLGWLRRISGKPYKARVIHSKPIGGLLGLEVGNPERHAVNLEVALAYVLKGATAEAAMQFGLTRLEPGGLVIGKRCGASQNIGPKARKVKGHL